MLRFFRGWSLRPLGLRHFAVFRGTDAPLSAEQAVESTRDAEPAAESNRLDGQLGGTVQHPVGLVEPHPPQVLHRGLARHGPDGIGQRILVRAERRGNLVPAYIGIGKVVARNAASGLRFVLGLRSQAHKLLFQAVLLFDSFVQPEVFARDHPVEIRQTPSSLTSSRQPPSAKRK